MKHDVVYLVYVYIPDEVYKKIEGLNYIYNHFEFDSKTRIWSGLYGWTYKKKVMNRLMDIHNDKMCKTVTVHEDDESFMKLIAELESGKNSILKISKYPYFTEGERNVELYTTVFEKQVTSQDDFNDTALSIFKDTMGKKKYANNLPEPCMFKKDIYNSLVKLGYEYMYYNLFCQVTDDDESIDEDSDEKSRYEAFLYNTGWGLSMDGSIEFKQPDQDQLKTLILLFGRLLKTSKNEDKEE